MDAGGGRRGVSLGGRPTSGGSAFVEDGAQAGDVGVGEVGAFAEVGEHRTGGTAEDALQKGFALAAHALLTGAKRRVHVGLAVAVNVEDALVH